MLRYIAFASDPDDPVHLDAIRILETRVRGLPHRWQCALAEAGLSVFYTHSGGTPKAIDCRQLRDAHQGRSGVVMGALFERTPNGAAREKPALTLAEQERILSSGGPALIESYWGSYIAFIYDVHNGTQRIIRAPLGHLPCFRLAFRGIEVFFSCLEDCLALQILPVSIDWEFIRSYTLTQVQFARTALMGVSEIQYGECVEIQNGRASQKFLWNPGHIARSRIINDPSEAANELEQSTKLCIHSWASRYDTILHYLSGGFDSSCVLSFLADAPTRPEVICVNQYSPGASSDERAFARIAAEFARVELIEQCRDTAVELQGLLHFQRTAKPQGNFASILGSKHSATLANQRGADALFNGDGGDGLFYHDYARFTAIDLVHQRGLHPSLFSVCMDAALLEGFSVWRVLCEALYRGLTAKWMSVPVAPVETRESLSLLSRTAQGSTADPPSSNAPWELPDRLLAPGKAAQMKSLLALPVAFYEPYGHPGSPELATPLMSQPLFELCLRIPTYLLMADGWDRAAARTAFASRMPREILQRRSKGGIKEYYLEVLKRNIKFVRTLLLEGALVREGILDRARLESVLSERPTSIPSAIWNIFHYVYVEAWLKTWEESKVRIAV